jgi:hypothetical protein
VRQRVCAYDPEDVRVPKALEMLYLLYGLLFSQASAYFDRFTS